MTAVHKSIKFLDLYYTIVCPKVYLFMHVIMCPLFRGQPTLQSASLQQQQAHLNQQLENLANAPFGDSPLFRNALSVSIITLALISASTLFSTCIVLSESD